MRAPCAHVTAQDSNEVGPRTKASYRSDGLARSRWSLNLTQNNQVLPHKYTKGSRRPMMRINRAMCHLLVTRQ
jgi:hypothetical protein